MSDTRPLLTYDPQGVFLDDWGITRSQLAALTPVLDATRREVCERDEALFAEMLATCADEQAEKTLLGEKFPLDAGFFALPEKILAEYRAGREQSELGQILRVANRLAAEVDRVVVLGIGGSYMGARALMDACCHPYFNELDRGRRGSRPRLYFEGNNVDNDAAWALRDVLAPDHTPGSLSDQWAIVVISKSGGTYETAVAFRQFLDLLEEAPGIDADSLKRRVIPVTGDAGKLFDLATEIGCPDIFRVPRGVGGRFSVLSPVGLLPAAVLGLDVVQLLEGAAALNAHFRAAPADQNLVLQYVGVAHLLEVERQAAIRVLSVWAKSLEATGLWYDQLLAESLGKQGRGATPITAVNTRDLHSRAQQHQEGARDKLHTNLIVDQWRREPLAVGRSDRDQDKLNRFAEITLPESMTAAVQGTNAAYRHGSRPTANLHLPAVNEYYLGQFFQMMMLATVVEGRLIGVNPYGQPGVQAYKENMMRILTDSGGP